MPPPRTPDWTENNLTILLPDHEATDRFGAMLAHVLTSGEMVLISGGLGTGKSTLLRAVIRTLAKDPNLDVPSPSYALVQHYVLPSHTVLHADLYRLSHEAEIDELGLFDDQSAIVLVEWPERAPRLIDHASYCIDLDIPADGKGRKLMIGTSGSQSDLARLMTDAGFSIGNRY